MSDRHDVISKLAVRASGRERDEKLLKPSSADRDWFCLFQIVMDTRVEAGTVIRDVSREHDDMLPSRQRRSRLSKGTGACEDLDVGLGEGRAEPVTANSTSWRLRPRMVDICSMDGAFPEGLRISMKVRPVKMCEFQGMTTGPDIDTCRRRGDSDKNILDGRVKGSVAVCELDNESLNSSSKGAPFDVRIEPRDLRVVFEAGPLRESSFTRWSSASVDSMRR